MDSASPRGQARAPIPGQVRLGRRCAVPWRWREAVTGLFLSCFIMLSIKPLKQKQCQSRGNSRPAAGKNAVAGPRYTEALSYEAKLELAGSGKVQTTSGDSL